MTDTDPDATEDAHGERLRRLPAFLLAMVALDGLGLTLGSSLPPEVQPVVFGTTLLAAPLVAFWLVYRGGFERLFGALGRE